jgi:hypothetical protein
MMRLPTGLVAGAFLAFFASSATAATITVVGGATTDDCSLSNFTVSVACDGDFSATGGGGNVQGSDLNGLFLADGTPISGWSLLDSIGSVSSGGEQLSSGGLFKINTTDQESGTWTLVDPFAFSAFKSYVFVLKGATNQVAYFMDSTFFNGNWNNTDLGFTNPGGQFTVPELSNIRLFEVDSTVIPLPAAGWLLIGGIGALVAVRRRKKAA